MLVEPFRDGARRYGQSSLPRMRLRNACHLVALKARWVWWGRVESRTVPLPGMTAISVQLLRSPL